MSASAVIKYYELACKQFWVEKRQPHAVKPPVFTLKQDEYPVVPVELNIDDDDTLIPIRLEIDLPDIGVKFRDAFLWCPPANNLAEGASLLAGLVCRDHNVRDLNTIMPIVQSSLCEQAQDFIAFFEAKEKFDFSPFRAVIYLDILIDNVQYTDQFILQLSDDHALWRHMGLQIEKEYKLPPQLGFAAAIHFSIFEQVCQIQRALLAVGWTVIDSDGGISDTNNKNNKRVSLNHANHDAELMTRLVLDHGVNTASNTPVQPVVAQLAPSELERLEIALDREGRRKRRQVRGRRDTWSLPSPPKLHKSAYQAVPLVSAGLNTQMDTSSKPVLDYALDSDLSDGEDEEYKDTDDEVYRYGGRLSTANRRGSPKRGRKRGSRGRRRRV